MSKLPVHSRAIIESKILFHYYDEFVRPEVYLIAKSVVNEDKVAEIVTAPES